MLLKVDAAQLEFRAKVWLAQDEVGLKEIQSGFDLHSDNQKKFDLPDRTIAKNFIYRGIFADAFGPKGCRGPGYAYANDADFMHVSSSVDYWANVLEGILKKYEGIRAHSVDCIRRGYEDGIIVNPSGRFYLFEPFILPNGEQKWPRTKMLNSPVQGISADFMMLYRTMVFRKLQINPYYLALLVLLINTVHDDVELDVDNNPEIIYNISIMLEDTFTEIPAEFEKVFGVHMNMPLAGEVKFGVNLYDPRDPKKKGDMMKFKRKTFEEDYYKYVQATKHGS